MSKIILFNSPKNVGKTEAIKYLRSKGVDLVSADCKEALHELTMTLFGVEPSRYWEIYNTRELKEVPLPEFRVRLTPYDLHSLENNVGQIGWDADIRWDCNDNCTTVNLSIRQAMIYVSEIIIKPRFNSDWFGQERVRRMEKYKGLDGNWLPSDVVFCDDSCAFSEELYPLIDRIGQENILLIRIHRDGFTFLGDSRSYIPDGVITNTVDITNNGTEDEYKEKVYQTVVGWLNDKK